MPTDSNYLFVYGTLRPSFDNHFARYLRQHSEYMGECAFPGLLFDLGTYPGAVYRHDSLQLVRGSFYDIGKYKRTLLACLDDYEGISDQFAQPTEYVRTLIPIVWKETTIHSWAYLYNLSTTNESLIRSGDYSQYRIS